MKLLTHRTPETTANPFDIDALKSHLRIDHSDDDSAIAAIGMTAAAEIEQFAQIALLTQTIRMTFFDPIKEINQSLPIGPVADDASISVLLDGIPFTDFVLVGGHRAMIRFGESFDALIPTRMTIEYTAGFGLTADDIPLDLAQAIMDQAALHYDGRSPMDAKRLTTSPHMARIGARYRGVQI